MTLDVDVTKALRVMDDIAVLTKTAAPMMIKNETRLLMLDLIRKTPPKTKAQGEKAIEKDMSKLFTHIETGFLDRVGSEFGIKSINHWITMSNGRKVNLQWDVLDSTGYGMSEYHQRSRNSRGRVPKSYKGETLQGDGYWSMWKSKYVVTNDDYAAYGTGVQRHVGFMKSGWVKGLSEVSRVSAGGLPNFVLNHNLNAFGRAQSNFSNPDKASVTIANNAPGVVPTMSHVVGAALATRQQALSRKYRQIVKDIKENVTAGRRFYEINPALLN